MMGFVHLHVRVGLIYDLSTLINFNFDLSSVCFLDTTTCLKGLSA
jgi:hypothetical protein